MFVCGPRAFSSCISMSSISACLAISMAFSAVPPMPMPSIPGGHQPAPIVGTVLSTQSRIESDGLSITNLDLASEPPPLAATVTSSVLPGTSDTSTTQGVLSTVFLRANAGSARIEPRSLLSGSSHARRTPSSQICCRLSVGALPSDVIRRTSRPSLRKMVTMPVSWQMGRWPSAHMRELTRICLIASFAAGDCSSS
jgi:hypothetical protein